MLHRDDASRGSTYLHRFVFLAIGYATADIEHDFSQRCPQGNLDQAGVVHLAHEAQRLCPLAFLGANAGKPVGALMEDLRDIRPGLNVVEGGRFTEKALVRGERRPLPRVSPLSLDGDQQGCLLSADEGAGTREDIEREIETGTQDVIAEHSVFPGLSDGVAQGLDGEGIFGADVGIALVHIADGICADGHTFDNRVGIALKDGAVHVGPGIAFVTIADNVFFVARGAANEAPFSGCREAGTAPSPEPCFIYLSDDLFWFHLGQSLGQGLIAIPGNVLLDAHRVHILVMHYPDLLELHPGCIFVQNPFLDGLATHKVLLNDPGHPVLGYLGIDNPFLSGEGDC